jgi:hypothetical protein
METEMLSLRSFADPALAADDLLARLAWLRDIVRPRLERFLGYYRNPTTELAAALPGPMGASFSVRPFRQYQELGLPARITGFRRAADGAAIATGAIDVQRKEIVIENDIAWRINTLVDFAAGQLPAITSTARDPATQKRLTTLITAILDGSGGVTLLQQLLLQGAIGGCAWVHLRPTAALLALLTSRGGGPQAEIPDEDIASTASPATAGEQSPDVSQWLRLEVVDAVRLCPLPQVGESANAECGPAYAALVNCMGDRDMAAIAPGSILDRVRSWFDGALTSKNPAQAFSFDLFGPTHWQRYVGGVRSAEGANPLGFVPFFRYENQPDPAAGTRVGPSGSGAVDTGFSDIEPLIALQDELNTRLSDRANRVTMSSFRMYLGKGIEDFTKRPVGPGQMWATDNVQASVDAFGGDATTPSEDSHISEVRQALDKISGVSPIAAGVIGSKIGNLTSAVALRLTLIALLSRTDRKRAALARTISTAIRQVLAVLDAAGIAASSPEDRGIDIHWPSALPDSALDQLQEAQMKLALGVPRRVVLSELGYDDLPATAAIPATT